ncbi:MAG: cytochrome c biogenesis protein ResB [Planctomycetota bacterium]|jgi:hypothetical protein
MENLNIVLRVTGSLWFAVVLLALLMLSMGSATVFEVVNGTERALTSFYHAFWFKGLLALIAINVLSAVVLRYPFSRRQTGLVITHAGILLTLAGALITDHFGIDGKVGIAEGQTLDSFHIPRETFAVVNLQDRIADSQDLDPSVIGGFEAKDHPPVQALNLGDSITVDIVQYQPDLTWEQTILNDNLTPDPAVEVSLSSSGRDDAVWLFTGQNVPLGTVNGTFRMIGDRKELDRLLADTMGGGGGSVGSAKIEYGGSIFEIPVEECMNEAAPVGDTGYTLRVLRYLPHAIVEDNRTITNASQQPVNPAIEAVIDGPAGKEKRLAFAKFPDFRSMHGEEKIKDLELTFVSTASSMPTQPVEILGGPDGGLFVRFSWVGTKVSSHELEIGVPVETPWPGMKFSVLRRFENARIEYVPTRPDKIRNNREPALLVQMKAPEQTREIWVQKFNPETVTIDGTPYELTYGNKPVPLGFELTLNRFRVGYYPGGERARSYESYITITDLDSGRTLDRIVGMNSPASYGGYTLYQSSYRQDGQHTVSFLSVSRDPGQLVAFTGYIATIAGMLLVLGTRLREQRMRKRMAAEEFGNQGSDQ